MNGRTAKLLRKAAKMTGRSDSYIKNNFRQMPAEQKVLYLAYIKESSKRYTELLKQLQENAPKPEEVASHGTESLP